MYLFKKIHSFGIVVIKVLDEYLRLVITIMHMIIHVHVHMEDTYMYLKYI